MKISREWTKEKRANLINVYKNQKLLKKKVTIETKKHNLPKIIIPVQRVGRKDREWNHRETEVEIPVASPLASRAS